MKKSIPSDHSFKTPDLKQPNKDLLEIHPDKNNCTRFTVRIYSEFPLTFYGGGERLIVKIYKHFKSLSIPVKIIDNYSKISEERIKREDLINEVGPDLMSSAFRRYGYPSILYQYMPDLKDLIVPSNDISMIFSRRIPPRKILRSLSRSKNKFVFCLHGIALEKFRCTHARIIGHQIVIRLQLRYFSRYVRENIYAQCLTPSTTSYLIQNGSDNYNVFIIENEFENELTELKDNSDAFRVIFIGRMQNLTKGIVFLRKVITIISRLEPNIKFIVIGKGPDLNILDKIQAKATIFDNANDKLKGTALQSSNLGIITSNLEPFSLVLQEFLVAGIPVVTTPVSGPEYILSKNVVFGKVSSFNPKLFSEDIIAYYNEWKKDKERYFIKRKEIAIASKNIFQERRMLDGYLDMVLEIGSKE